MKIKFTKTNCDYDGMHVVHGAMGDPKTNKVATIIQDTHVF